MHILIIGAGGMIGSKLAATLAQSGTLNGRGISRMTLVDVVEPPAPNGAVPSVEVLAADISAPGVAKALAARRANVIFHLAAIVSGEAERDFEKGYRINLDGTRALFEAIRLEGRREAYAPRLVFTSSLAVYGAPLPDPIPDDYVLAPLTSYGVQKAISELLLSDYSRRGFFDGIGIRLPTGGPTLRSSGKGDRQALAGKPTLGRGLPHPCCRIEYVRARRPAHAEHAGCRHDGRRSACRAAARGRT